MTTLVCSAIALALSGAGDAPATQPSDVPSTERDFASLASLLGDEQSPVTVGAYMKTAYRDDNFVADHDGGNHEGDISFNSLRIWVGAKVGDFDFKASIEGAAKKDGGAGTEAVKDFWVRRPICSGVNVQVGNFKSPFLFTGVESDERQIFYDRTTQGGFWAGREPGVQLDGKHGLFTWWAAAQNGNDAEGDQFLYTARAAFAIVGEPIPMKQTGGFGPKSPTRVQAAVGYVHDRGEATGNARATCGELTAITGPIFFHGEVVDYDDGFTAASITGGNAKAAAAANVGETTPWSATLGAMFTETDEIAARFERLQRDDDGDGDEDQNFKTWLGYTRYLAGQGAKVQAFWVHSESDTTGGDVEELVVGLTVSV